jgi:hypothetical protein
MHWCHVHVHECSSDGTSYPSIRLAPTSPSPRRRRLGLSQHYRRRWGQASPETGTRRQAAASSVQAKKMSRPETRLGRTTAVARLYIGRHIHAQGLKDGHKPTQWITRSLLINFTSLFTFTRIIIFSTSHASYPPVQPIPRMNTSSSHAYVSIRCI